MPDVNYDYFLFHMVHSMSSWIQNSVVEQQKNLQGL